MTKYSGLAPRPARRLPLRYLRLILRCAIRVTPGPAWTGSSKPTFEHRLRAALDAPDPSRFSQISAHTVLLGGATSPPALSSNLMPELAQAIQGSTVVLLEGLGHFAPRDQPARIACAVL